MASASDLSPDGAAKPPPSGRDRSRLDGYIGLKRESSEPWISRYAAHIRIALPVIALVVVLAGVIGPMFGEATGLLVRRMPLETDRGHYMRMDRPHFAGNDKHQRPYTVTAVYAVQKRRDEKVLDLFRPKADLLDKKERKVVLTAEHGRFDQQLRMLDLDGNVMVNQDGGYTLTTQRARIDLDAQAAYGDRPIAGHGPAGEIQAEGFHASERGDRVVFTGRTRLVLRSNEQTDSEAQPSIARPTTGG